MQYGNPQGSVLGAGALPVAGGLVSTPFVLELAAGAHTIQLDPLPDTASDFNDPFLVVALELPR